MFEKMKNIDSAFSHIRLFSIVFLLECMGTTLFIAYKSYEAVSKAQSRIYLLANGKALEAYSAERKDNIPVEARDHVKMFHHYFFTLDLDEKVIQGNITKALYLADASAKEQYDNLKENGYYSNIISGNISQEIESDSILINTEIYPYSFSNCFFLYVPYRVQYGTNGKPFAHCSNGSSGLQLINELDVPIQFAILINDLYDDEKIWSAEWCQAALMSFCDNID